MKKFKALLDLPVAELIKRADKVRQKKLGNKLDICTIFNAKSGKCSEDCKFCAQSGHYQTGALTYPLKQKEEILAAAKEAKKNGAARFGIVTSGNKLTKKDLEQIAEMISEIKNKIKIEACASLGALSLKELLFLKEAGLVRYHHNIETSPNFYPKIVSTHKFAERLKTIKAAKKAGLFVCAGGIIGLGESWQDRIEMALLLKKLKVDSIPLNILVPIKGTPLENSNNISCTDAVKTIALFRLILQDKIIKIAAGRETVFKDFQALGFLAGANGMLIGGYLTIKGRDVSDDQNLIKEIKQIWQTSANF